MEDNIRDAIMIMVRDMICKRRMIAKSKLTMICRGRGGCNINVIWQEASVKDGKGVC